MSPGSDPKNDINEPVEIELDVIKTPKGLVPSVEGLHQVVERIYHELIKLKTENRSLYRLLADHSYSLESTRSELAKLRETLDISKKSSKVDIRKLAAQISAVESSIEDHTVNLEIKIRTLEKKLE